MRKESLGRDLCIELWSDIKFQARLGGYWAIGARKGPGRRARQTTRLGKKHIPEAPQFFLARKRNRTHGRRANRAAAPTRLSFCVAAHQKFLKIFHRTATAACFVAQAA
eukprot:scaffold192790_cov29-Tisochrysis_lutea.AAC.3